jgi:hypothetical protein
MQNNLIQALTAYTTALEQKLSALEARVGSLQSTVDSLQLTNDSLKAEIEKLSAASYQPTTETEPEVEVELIMDDEELDIEETLEQINNINFEELSEEKTEEPEIEVELILEDEEESPLQVPTEEESNEEPMETLEIVEETPTIEEPIAEPTPATEEPAAEPELVIEEPAVEKSAPRVAPIQTSLFGNTVEDIRKAISLGDRFLFQRELFAGNGELMQQTLDEINNLDSLDEAIDFVYSQFDWDKESTAVQLFENVLKRRFG